MYRQSATASRRHPSVTEEEGSSGSIIHHFIDENVLRKVCSASQLKYRTLDSQIIEQYISKSGTILDASLPYDSGSSRNGQALCGCQNTADVVLRHFYDRTPQVLEPHGPWLGDSWNKWKPGKINRYRDFAGRETDVK